MELISKEKLSEQKERNIKSVKKQVRENIVQYIQKQKKKVSLRDYIQTRESFLNKIWNDEWKTRLISSYSGEIKKEYLKSIGVEVDFLKPKSVNQLFCEKLTEPPAFSIIGWLKDEYLDKWESIVNEALNEKKNDVKMQKKKRYHQEILRPCINEVIVEKWEYFYLHVRKEMFTHLKKNIEEAKLYKLQHENENVLIESGKIDKSKYEKVYQFLEEYTGEITIEEGWNQRYEEHETYHDRYTELLDTYLDSDFLFLLKENVPTHVKWDFENIMNKKMTVEDVLRAINQDLSRISEEMMEELENEPFYLAMTLTQDKREIETEWKERLKEKEEERLRKQKEKEEEEKRIQIIFGNHHRDVEHYDTKYFLHLGDTNTGKTFTALERMKQFEKGIYLAPLRLLALEVYEKLNKDGVKCNLKTGEEEKKVEGAHHLACTIEMFRENERHDIVIIDEAQMISDKERGFSWYRSIVGADAKEVHIIGNPSVREMVLQLLGEVDIEVVEYERKIPLVVQDKKFLIQDVQEGDALVAFSRRKVLQIASKLESDGHKVSVIYGNMPPESRQRQIEEFIEGKTKVVVATDAIGMGLNLPIKRIIFMDSEKFDGSQRRRLTVQEVKQIAGRAGRKGLYEEGTVVFTSEKKQMKKLLTSVDKPIEVFTIAPTRATFERFGEYYRDLEKFFELWKKYRNPKGTKKSTLAQEKMLYQMIKGTVVEKSFNMYDLYHFLQIPFSSKENELTAQWKETMIALAKNREIPEPYVKKDSLEELELSYKSVELYLMFLYRLDRQTEAYYWERVKKELSDDIHIWLKENMTTFSKKCKTCNRNLEWDYPYGICQKCYRERYNYFYDDDFNVF